MVQLFKVPSTVLPMLKEKPLICLKVFNCFHEKKLVLCSLKITYYFEWIRNT
jgi:hypothetical protein